MSLKDNVVNYLSGFWNSRGRKYVLFSSPILALILLFLVGKLGAVIQPLVVFIWSVMPIVYMLMMLGFGYLGKHIGFNVKLNAGIISAVLLSAIVIMECGLAVIGLILAGAIAFLLMAFREKTSSLLQLVGASFFVAVLTWLIVANAVPIVQEWQLAQYIVRHTEELTEFPVTVNDRFLPRVTAVEYSKKANPTRTKEVSRSQLVWLPEGTITALDTKDKSLKAAEKQRCVWQAPLNYSNAITKNKFWHGFWGSQSGVLRLDCSDLNMNSDVTSGKEAEFLFGSDSWVTNLLFMIRHPLSKRAETIHWPAKDGSWVFVTSFVSYTATWTGTMIPVMEGIVEFGSLGGFRTYSPVEAGHRYHGATLFPPSLARTYGSAYDTFRLGLVDYLWTQEGQLEISEEPDDKDHYPHANSHPFYENFQAIGPQLVIPYEPKGPNSHKLSRVLLFDAASGKIRGYSLKENGRVINAPRTALANVQEAVTEINWNQFKTAEPLTLHTKDDRWYVQVTVTSVSGQNAVVVIIVDAENLKPYKFDSPEEAQHFVETGVAPVRRSTAPSGK